MGQPSDPYDEAEDDGIDLRISGLPEELDEPEDAAQESSGLPDDQLVDDVEDEYDESDSATGEDDPDDESDGDGETDDEDGGENDEDDEEVAYDLSEWEDDHLDALFEALDEAELPYLWDGDELFVKAADEQAVDEVLDKVSNPHALDAEDDDGDGGGWLLGELFVVADRLQHDPEEHESVALMLQLANAADEAEVPYGLAEPEWEALRERVTALATVLEAEEVDVDAAIEAAKELRGATRRYV